MESKQIRSSVIARSMSSSGLFRPLHQEKLRASERLNQPKRNCNSNSNSAFSVIPTKELCRLYLQKPNLLASKGIIDAQATPPHTHKSLGFKLYGEMANHRKFKPKLRQRTGVDPLKSKIGKKERYFSPLGFGSGSHLGDAKKRLHISLAKKSKKLSDFDQRVTRQIGSNLIVTTSRDSSVLSLEQNFNDRVAADVKLRHISSSAFITKDDNDDSLEDCSNATPGCQMNSEEAHQPSPVSVLEPMFYEDLLDSSDELPYLDFHGVEKQLETLKSESESYSDGSGMEVSSDEESVLDSETKERKKDEATGFLGTQKSRDSCYIDDILAEVLLGNKNWVSEKRDSLDLVSIPKIFEKLEMKYSKETSWKRSERRILFDRVNSGLIEILESFNATPTWKKPVSRRLDTALSMCGLKQELWKGLARQEKRAKKEFLAKVPVIHIDDWVDLEADDESVVCELESMIVDELLSEVVSFM